MELKTKADDKLAKARELAIELARVASHTRCHNVVILEVAGVSPITDYFVLATGTSPRQMRTVCDDCLEAAQAKGSAAKSCSGYAENSAWVCVDLVDVVIHLFSDEARAYYDLDNLWGDAPRIAWESGPTLQPVK